MKREDDQQLWDLLARTAQPEVSSLFSRDVLRRLREERRPGDSFKSWFSLRRLVPLSGIAVAVAAAVIFVHNYSYRHESALSDPIARIDVQDYEVVADLDDLLGSDDNNLWDETSSL